MKMSGRASFCQRKAALVEAIREGATLLAGVDARYAGRDWLATLARWAL
jgi:hypothetical protein